MTGRGGFLRENALLVAAVSLPLAVVSLFLIATAVPRWLVAPPAHDFLFRVDGRYDQAAPRIAVEFTVRDGRVEGAVRPIPAGAYPQIPRLLLFEHETQNVREISLDLSSVPSEADPPVTLAIPALAGRRVLAQPQAPDGYELDTGTHRRTGLVGELFGMRSRSHRVALVKRGRVVPIPLPSDTHGYGVSVVGWVLNEGSH